MAGQAKFIFASGNIIFISKTLHPRRGGRIKFPTVNALPQYQSPAKQHGKYHNQQWIAGQFQQVIDYFLGDKLVIAQQRRPFRCKWLGNNILTAVFTVSTSCGSSTRHPHPAYQLYKYLRQNRIFILAFASIPVKDKYPPIINRPPPSAT